MIHLVYTIHDNKSLSFTPPFFTPNRQVAERHFVRAATDPALDIGRFPTDFTLFEIGTFDNETGVITPHAEHINLGLATLYQER